ncbi:PREDICTED: F-box/kelch-repeat protein At3g23880-like [Fragaria vesca subsp. vesca]|uniref:F-box/kelch-repeat protein At3g23880-like n=1 Tax=Fragaria vesca subsp. vesca TaxID=101020 RepID=UPI0002C308B0|nr:PREDICTED: F-box/kelch-repeat protein At3g23880-like [Fragaria vesca subsp. vesca]
MTDHLPEDVIVEILKRLPTKSLIRFTSVSKSWRSIILYDPKFAKSQFQLQTVRHSRILISNPDEPELESRDSFSSFGDDSSVRKLIRCPFIRSVHRLYGRGVNLLGSCNGLVCAQLDHHDYHIYIWNPSTGFFYELPEPVGFPPRHLFLLYYGFGYLSASDDYKVFTKFYDDDGLLIFSSKANIWKRTDAPAPLEYYPYQGILSNEALHWLHHRNGICAFDLAKEEF